MQWGEHTDRPEKDREFRLQIVPGVVVLVERSSAHPIYYSIVLLTFTDGAWRTVLTFDNAHHVDEHHAHSYRDGRKQLPTITHGPVNEAMAAALDQIQRDWPTILEAWEQNR